jgi:hypothetical protein
MGLAEKKPNDFSSLIDRRNLGPGDSLRYNVFTHIIENQTERAVRHIEEYCEKHSEFPVFKRKVEKNAKHAIDLIHAIQAKREFLGSGYLTIAKQQELHEKLKFHISELQQTLKRMEKTFHDLRIEDVRSTVIVLKTATYSLLAIVGLAFFLDMAMHGGFRRLMTAVDQIVLDIIRMII